MGSSIWCRREKDCPENVVDVFTECETYLSIFPKALTDDKWAGGGLNVNRHDVMEVRVIGWRLPLEGWRVLPGKPIDPFRTNG